MAVVTETYAEWLARTMEQRGFTQRSLARAWNPEDSETARRAIRRYLNGVEPIERTRIELSRVLGVKQSGPEQPEADKEGDRSGARPLSARVRARLARRPARRDAQLEED